MTKKINKKLLLTILILISLILAAAYLIEYQLNYQPCKLCIYERVPYIFSIFLIFFIMTNPDRLVLESVMQFGFKPGWTGLEFQSEFLTFSSLW